VAAGYVAGIGIDWAARYATSDVRRIALPTYPFQRQRHWIPQSSAVVIPPVPQPLEPTEPAAAQREIEAPGSDIERRLIEIWRKVLGFEHVSVTDNFFDLGGGSLMAVEVMARIEQAFGARLEPRVFFERPTIRQLAELLVASDHQPPSPLLVTIRAAGSKAPVFLIAPDHLYHYVHLARLVQPDHPIYGLQPPYFEGFRRKGITIEQMADAYMEHLLDVCPSGESHFIGLCAGGVVAYEMAQRLLSSGREVGLLALLDAPCPAPAGTPALNRRGYVGARFMSHARALTRMSPPKALRYVLVRARIAGEAALLRWGKRTRRPVWAKALASIANRAAIYRYRAQPYPGTVHVVLASEPYPSAREDTRLRWRELAHETKTMQFRSRHDQLLAPAHVAAVAELLNAALVAKAPAASHAAKAASLPVSEDATSGLRTVQLSTPVHLSS
jgi:thioesterase domain-containing protein/acyl carrier protein